MAKKPLDLETIIPPPEEITAEAGTEITSGEIDITALRRGKVRELTRMGYKTHQIVLILDKGIKVGNKTIKVPVSESIVSQDINYIRQEDAAISIDFAEKRAELLDKLDFLYNRAVTEYINAKGAVKNSFLNTALAVLSRVIDLEGVKSPEAVDISIHAEAKIAKFAAEIHKLSKDDQITIISAIRKVLEQRQPERDGNSGIPSKSSRI